LIGRGVPPVTGKNPERIHKSETSQSHRPFKEGE